MANKIPAIYKPYIARIVRNLKVDMTNVEWKFTSKASVGKSTADKTGIGDICITFGVPLIRVSTAHGLEATIDTIAHELRHLWQIRTKIWVEEVEWGKYDHEGKDFDAHNRNGVPIIKVRHAKTNTQVKNTWKGTEYYPYKKVWYRMKYELRPCEVDARLYAQFITAKIMKGIKP